MTTRWCDECRQVYLVEGVPDHGAHCNSCRYALMIPSPAEPKAQPLPYMLRDSFYTIGAQQMVIARYVPRINA